MLTNDGKPLMLLHVIKLEHNILRGTPVPLPAVGCRLFGHCKLSTVYDIWLLESHFLLELYLRSIYLARDCMTGTFKIFSVIYFNSSNQHY